MNRKPYVLAFALILIGIVFGTLLSSKFYPIPSVQARQSNTWEFKAISGTREHVINQANQLGKQGWELVSVAPDDHSVSQQYQHVTFYSAFLKRPL